VSDSLRIFNESLDRCLSQPEFLSRFYEILLASSEEIGRKFKHTDFKRQKEALKTALYVLLFAHEWSLKGDAYLRGLARRHSRQDLDVRPELYDLWLDCLIETVSEFDPFFEESIADSWRIVLGPGIKFMKSAY
jgi:hemoglobin-like flavoprotein